MNTGLQDAHNLAWKIAGLFRQKIEDDDQFVEKRKFWLDSHEGERRPVAMQNAALSVRNYNRVLALMKECYLNHKHPDLLKEALDRMEPFVPLSVRQQVFRSLLQTALKPLAWLGNSSSPSSFSLYRQHIESNLQRLLTEGAGLPLLFPRFELGFGYRHHHQNTKDHSNQDDEELWDEGFRYADTWADPNLQMVRVGYRLPHAPIDLCSAPDQEIRPQQGRFFEWSTIDLPSLNLSKLGDNKDNCTATGWVILVVDTKSPAAKWTEADILFWEKVRVNVEKATQLPARTVYLSSNSIQIGKSLDHISNHENSQYAQYAHFHLNPNASAWLDLNGIALIRPDGHVAAWAENNHSAEETILGAILN